MAVDHARIARSFDALAVALRRAAGDAAFCASSARTFADDPDAADRVTYRAPDAVIAGLTAALDAWRAEYVAAIDTAQPGTGSIALN